LVRHAYLRLGDLNFQKGKWAKAAEYFELFLEKYPEDIRFGQVLYDLGRAYEMMGELELAAEVYSVFIETGHPNEPRIKVLKAKIESWQGAEK